MGLSSIKKMCRYFLVLVLFASVIVSTVSCKGENDLEEFFAEWEPEIDPNIAIADFYNDILTVGNKTYDLELLSQAQYFSPNEMIVIRDGLLYVMQTHYNREPEREYELRITIHSIDLETLEVKRRYIGEYCSIEAQEQTGEISYVKVYYSDGKIILYDKFVMTVLDIDTYIAKDYPAEEFVYPYKYVIDNVNGEGVQYCVYDRIKIASEDEERVITVDYVAQRNEYVRSLTEIEYGFPYFQKNLMESFFGAIATNLYTIIDDKIYLLTSFPDQDGEENVLVFSYDFPEDKFTFLHHNFSSYNSATYLIPAE